MERRFPLPLVWSQIFWDPIQEAVTTKKSIFIFSLLFIGYAVKNPLKKEDRLDLYKHEYAHYMQHNFHIPQEYQWQHGTHGSAWKYCCSLTGAAPTHIIRQGKPE